MSSASVTTLPLPAPRKSGLLPWLRRRFFSSFGNGLLTVLSAALLAWVIPPLVNWAFVQAHFAYPPDVLSGLRNPTGADCPKDGGACWIYIRAHLGQFFYGFYPSAERWRVDLDFLLMAIGIGGLIAERVRGKKYFAIFLFGIFPFLAFWLLYGGFGLRVVPTAQWGGLLLTFVVGGVAIVLGPPLGILLALGRRSSMPLLATCTAVLIEIVRGVPLITILFMTNVMLPLFLPPGMNVDVLLRVLVGIVLFTAAYIAEVVRGGLQAIPRGQYEAAQSVGLNYWGMMGLVVLPQALRITLPGIMNTLINLFQDTSLVSIIGLYDFLNIIRVGNKDPNWLGYQIEGFVFAGFVYWVIGFLMSRYSARLEKRLDRDRHARKA
ncbi:MAG TPA: amino acid ABC transporter permease [Dongiaceae bacterium]|jgi:general L-amino acid transport system permease protein|nr:amino acid ABC transporter permease [Dongiaceae bacterium]